MAPTSLRRIASLAAAATLLALTASTSIAAPTDARIKLALRASGLTKPVFVTSAHDSTGRLFIVEQTGRIKIYKSGTIPYSPSTGCNKAGKAPPMLVYDHSNGPCAVTGGYVSRGSLVPKLYGGYVFGDFSSGEIWVVNAIAATPAKPVRLLDTSLTISSFGENQAGDLYVVDHDGGKLYAIVPA